jgi:hypothetical protein
VDGTKASVESQEHTNSQQKHHFQNSRIDRIVVIFVKEDLVTMVLVKVGHSNDNEDDKDADEVVAFLGTIESMLAHATNRIKLQGKKALKIPTRVATTTL